MTENKRFVYYEHKGADYILENPNTELDFIEMLGDCLEAEEIVDKLNELNDECEFFEIENEALEHSATKYAELYHKSLKENEQLKQSNEYLQGQLDDYSGVEVDNIELRNENEQLKEHIKSLEKELYLIHMQSMFSTVKSFKGDVSKRYKYSEETDTIYDTANKYGQFNKILDKKEITMLLNEYETILKELEE